MKYKMLIGGLIFGMMVSFGTNSFAETNITINQADLQKIQAAAVKELKKNGIEPDATTINEIREVASKVNLTQVLRRGVKSDDVLALQKKLQELGYYNKALDADFGSGTLAAVRQFQAQSGLKVDGIVGPDTFTKIFESDFTLPPVLIDKEDETTRFCTAEYVPVCGQPIVNCVTSPCPQPEPKTFGNKCSLNAAGAKYLYAGECRPGEQSQERPCTKEYEPVCGLVNDVVTTFSNTCELDNAQAEFRHEGTCDLTKPIEPDSDISIRDFELQIKDLEKKIAELRAQLEKTQ